VIVLDNLLQQPRRGAGARRPESPAGARTSRRADVRDTAPEVARQYRHILSPPRRPGSKSQPFDAKLSLSPGLTAAVLAKRQVGRGRSSEKPLDSDLLRIRTKAQCRAHVCSRGACDVPAWHAGVSSRSAPQVVTKATDAAHGSAAVPLSLRTRHCRSTIHPVDGRIGHSSPPRSRKTVNNLAPPTTIFRRLQPAGLAPASLVLAYTCARWERHHERS